MKLTLTIIAVKSRDTTHVMSNAVFTYTTFPILNSTLTAISAGLYQPLFHYLPQEHLPKVQVTVSLNASSTLTNCKDSVHAVTAYFEA